MPAAQALASPGEWASWVAEADAVWASVSAQKPARVASSPRVPDPPRPADAPNRASSPSHGAAAPLRAVIDAGGFPAFARSTPGTARDPWPAARLFASGPDESAPAWSPFSPRFVAPDDENENDARASSGAASAAPRAAKPRPTFSSPSLIDLRRTSFSIDEAESIRAVVPSSATPRDDDANPPTANATETMLIPRLVPAAPETTQHPVPALPWSVLERMDRASGRHSLSPDPRGLIDAAHLRAIVHERRRTLEGSGGDGSESRRGSRGQPSGQPSGRERPTNSSATLANRPLDASLASALERRVGGAWATRAKMRELAFAALAAWRFAARRSRGSVLRALAFRASRHDRRLASRSFASWRGALRTRDAIERWLSASRRNRLVVAFERWTAVHFCSRPARVVARSEAVTRWRRSYLVPAFEAMKAMKAEYIDAPRVSADRFLFATLGRRGFARWRRKAARSARRRAWDAFVERWRRVRALSVGFNAWATLALVTLRTARADAEKMREDLAFERVVRAFSHWRRRARQITRGAALVDLACAKWDAERTRRAFGAMQAASVLRSARRADADEHAERWRLARGVERWRRWCAYERRRLAPAIEALAFVATKTRESLAFRDWRSTALETNASVARFRSAVSAKYLASRSVREWRALCRDLRASRRYAHAKLAPTRRRLLARAALRVFAANAETRIRIRAERLATGLELAALRRMHRAFERWLRVASERVLRRLQTRRAIRHRTHRALRCWRAHHASTADARERRRRWTARAVATAFATAWGAWREIVAACGKARRAVDRYSGSMRAGHQGFHGHAGRAGGGGLVGNTAPPVAAKSRGKRTFEDLFRGDLRFVAPSARARAKAIVAAMERRAIGAEAMRAWGEKAEREGKKNVLGMWSSRGVPEAKTARAQKSRDEEDDAETAATVAGDAETSSSSRRRPPEAPPERFERTSNGLRAAENEAGETSRRAASRTARPPPSPRSAARRSETSPSLDDAFASARDRSPSPAASRVASAASSPGTRYVPGVYAPPGTGTRRRREGSGSDVREAATERRLASPERRARRPPSSSSSSSPASRLEAIARDAAAGVDAGSSPERQRALERLRSRAARSLFAGGREEEEEEGGVCSVSWSPAPAGSGGEGRAERTRRPSTTERPSMMSPPRSPSRESSAKMLELRSRFE